MTKWHDKISELKMAPQRRSSMIEVNGSWLPPRQSRCLAPKHGAHVSRRPRCVALRTHHLNRAPRFPRQLFALSHVRVRAALHRTTAGPASQPSPNQVMPASNEPSVSLAHSVSASDAMISMDVSSTSVSEVGDHLALDDVHLRLSGGKRVQFGRASLPAVKRRRIYAPPPPRPWWQEPPRAAALFKRTDACATCDDVRLEASCERCEKQLCGLCTRLCDVCSMTWCTLCSLVDYDSPFERTLCLLCWEDANEQTERNGVSNNEVKHLDDDEEMISLE